MSDLKDLTEMTIYELVNHASDITEKLDTRTHRIDVDGMMACSARLLAILEEAKRRDAQRAQADAPITQEALREALADYAHKAWSGWMEYMFGKMTPSDNDTWAMPQYYVERWHRQMATPYAELSEQEKQSDRKEADEMIALMQKHMTGKPMPGGAGHD